MDARHTPIELEEALRHTDWLRRLALSLVKDPDSADELVQETWIRAWRSAPGGGASRAWLGTVLKRLSLNQGRSERRREARERLRARDEALPSATDLVQRAELQKRVTEAVLALPAAECEAILLHYFEGRSSAEIARRQGLPASTVRARVRRGLASLRDSLDRDYGARETWSGLVLLHFATAETATAAAGAAAVGVASYAGLTVLGWVLLATLSLAVTISLLIPEQATLPPLENEMALTVEAPAGLTGAAGPGELSVGAGAREEGGTRQEPTSGEARFVRTDSEAPVSPFPPAVLHARLIDTDGQPVRGGWLRIDGSKERAWSRVSGRFEHVVPSADLEPRQVSVLVGAEGFASVAHDVRLVAGSPAELGELVLERAREIRGRVTDGENRPVVGATVKAFGSEVGIVGIQTDDRRWTGPAHDAPVPTATTDEQGRFELTSVPLGRRRLWAGGAGHLWSPGERLVVSQDEEVIEQQLWIEPIAARDRISGVVQDPDGNPVPHALLSARMRLATVGAGSLFETDAAGRFSIDLRQRVPHDFEAFDPEQRWSRVTARQVAPGTRGLNLTFETTHRMRVQLRRESGEHVTDFEWQLEPQHANAPEVHWSAARVGADGFARIAQLSEVFFLAIRTPGRDPMRYGPFEPGPQTDRIEIVLTELPTVSGFVVGADGKPISGAQVKLHALLAPHERIMVDGQRCLIDPVPDDVGTTDARGAFELPFRGPGHYVLRATTGARPVAERWPLVLGSASVSGVVLTRGAGAELEVRYAPAPGETAAGRVVVLNHGDGEPRSARFDESGVLVFEGLTAGQWKLSLADEELPLTPSEVRAFRASGPSPMTWTCQLFDENRTSVILRERDPERLTVVGHLSVNGSPPQGWIVRGRHAGVPLDAEWFDSDIAEDGSFELPFEEEGRVALCVSAPTEWGNLVVRENLELDGEGPRRWSLDLNTGSFSARGLPVLAEGAALQLRQVVPVDGRELYLVSAVVPDAQGELRIPRLPVGLWTIVHYDPFTSRPERGSGWLPIGEFVVESDRETRFTR
jgi:RNA polymerase sigma factor (sigma-70 family)